MPAMPALFRRVWGLYPRAFNNAPLLLSMTMLFWAGNITIGRAVRDTIPPVTLSFWRWTIAFLLALAIGWRGVRADWIHIRRNWRILGILGFLGIACYNTLFYTGLHSAPVTHGVLINATGPLMIILLGGLLFGEKPPVAVWIGMGLAITGVAMTLRAASTLGGSVGVGEIWMGVAVLLYAFYAVLLRKRPPVKPLSFVVVTFGIGSTFLFPVYLLEVAYGPEISLTPASLSVFAYVGIFPSFIAYVFFNRGVELVGSARAGSYIYLVPVFGTVLAVIFLGETLQIHHFVGFTLVGTGLLLAERAASGAARRDTSIEKK